MEPHDPDTHPRPEHFLAMLDRQFGNLKTPGLANKVLSYVGKAFELHLQKGTGAFLNATRCLSAVQELDEMAIADELKDKIAAFMVYGLDPIEVFFGMLPAPKLHDECKNYSELAGWYRLPAEILAARSRLDRDPFRSSDADAPIMVDIVVKSAEKMGTRGTPVEEQMELEGVADLEAGLARLALSHPQEEVGDTQKHKFLSYLRWVVQGRKTVGSPFASQSPSKDTILCSGGYENLSTLSNGQVSGPCTNCGSQDAAHQCKLCLITLDGYVSEQTVSATTYCNESCRNAHFEANKGACREIRKLARSAVLFKEAFYRYIQIAGGIMPFSAIKQEQGIIFKQCTGTSNTVPSLRHLADSQSQADAAMTSFTCGDIIAWARPILEFLIQPCCTSVEFVNFSVKNADIAVANEFQIGSSHHLRYNTLRLHLAARLTLPSGAQYAFDPSAAQFGWKDCLAPWAEYARCRIHHIENVTVLDPLDGTRVPAKDRVKPSDIIRRFDWAKEYVAEELVSILRARKGGLRALLKLSDGQFETGRKDLADAMEDFVRDFAKSLK
ncbi:uncharacterized protein J7T55_006544 [Diaporthe amygdali]|uniref:uncharacterized protein n=1 Tax=Phomopsis amygdali TaxID=1214568 RepID=UPI0022FE8C1E|nr:uncharacterized protein J7T55_006544 [Diaporthe amygdali]KAJ0125199.1 uncharacterized protein J7T55_006544 [Diaporthe amygdali]